MDHYILTNKSLCLFRFFFLFLLSILGNGYKFVRYCEHTTSVGHDEVLERQTYYT